MRRLAWLILFCGLLTVAVSGWLSQSAFSSSLSPPEDVSPPLLPALAATQEVRSQSFVSPADGQPGVEVEKQPLPPVVAKKRRTPPLSGTKNILLVGIDRRPGVKRGGLPDTIVLAVLSPETGHLGLVSVPRDLYVDIPEHGQDRINATFSVAWSQKKKPLELLASVVSDTLVLPVHHTLAVDLGAFETLVDALGGVEVDVPCAIDDNFLDDRTESGRRLLSLDEGMNHLDGPTASLYVRSRHGRSDFSRARRQQAVLFGMKNQFMSMDGLSRLPEFWEELGEVIVSDLSRAEFLSLVRLASHIESDQVHGLVLGVEQAVPHRTEDGKAVLLPQMELIESALSELFSASSPGILPAGAKCVARDAAIKR